MPTHRHARGVTLIEAAIVIAVITIILAAAAPNFKDLIERHRLEGVATQLATDLHYARSEAVLRHARLRLSVHAQSWGSCYVIHTGLAGECSCRPAGSAECTGNAEQIKTVVLASADQVSVQGPESVAFDPLHGTSTPGGTLKVVSASGRAVHHVINIMGRVRSCTPQGSAPMVPGYRAC